MQSKIRNLGLAAALLAAPALTVAAEPTTYARDGAAKGENASLPPLGASRYDLASTNPPTVRDQARRPPQARAHLPHRRMARDGAKFAAALAVNIEGPAFSYRPTRRGPVVELGALGGGSMENTPFLAHLGVDWQF